MPSDSLLAIEINCFGKLAELNNLHVKGIWIANRNCSHGNKKVNMFFIKKTEDTFVICAAVGRQSLTRSNILTCDIWSLGAPVDRVDFLLNRLEIGGGRRNKKVIRFNFQSMWISINIKHSHVVIKRPLVSEATHKWGAESHSKVQHNPKMLLKGSWPESRVLAEQVMLPIGMHHLYIYTFLHLPRIPFPQIHT